MQSTFPSALCEVGAKRTSLPGIVTVHSNYVTRQWISWCALLQIYHYCINSIGHFRVLPGLSFKTRVGAQPLIWKSFFILMQIKPIFTRTIVHLATFWKWGFWELRSGLFLDSVTWTSHTVQVTCTVTLCLCHLKPLDNRKKFPFTNRGVKKWG